MDFLDEIYTDLSLRAKFNFKDKYESQIKGILSDVLSEYPVPANLESLLYTVVEQSFLAGTQEGILVAIEAAFKLKR